MRILPYVLIWSFPFNFFSLSMCYALFCIGLLIFNNAHFDEHVSFQLIQVSKLKIYENKNSFSGKHIFTTFVRDSTV